MGLLDRIRGEGAPTASTDGDAGGLADRLGSIARRGGQLAGRVAEGVKEATPKRLLRDAMDAHGRGNVGAAFFLVRESVEAEPGDVEADAFFWDVAIQYGEPGAATDSAARLVRHHAGQGATELAAQYFRELVGVSEPALVEPTVLVRLLPDLVAGLEAAKLEADASPAERGADAPGASHADRVAPDPSAHHTAILHALQMCVNPENTPLSPGMAMRVAELARPFDPDVSLQAAYRALHADDVHEAKRAKLVALIRELDPDADLDEEEALEVDQADLAAVSIELEVSEVAEVEETGGVEAEVAADVDAAASADRAVVPTDRDAAVDVHALGEPEDGVALVSPDPIAAPISEAEADRLTSFLEPAEEELEVVAVIGDITESEEVDAIDVLPELDPIDDSDPARNHPNRIESPVQALSEDEIDRMRERLERALGKNGAPVEAAPDGAPLAAEPSEAEVAPAD